MLVQTEADIRNKMREQIKKWGLQRHQSMYWSTILLEEIGKVARFLVKGDAENARGKLLNAIGVAIQWYEQMVDDDVAIEGWVRSIRRNDKTRIDHDPPAA